MSTHLNRPAGMPAYFLGRDVVTWRAALEPRRTNQRRRPLPFANQTTTSAVAT